MKARNTTARIILHHSLSEDVSVDTVRGWHVEGNGWEDIGYHFCIHEDGTVEHGRHLHLEGAHAKGRNADSVGICMLGNFKDKQPTLWQYWGVCRIIRALNTIYCKELAVEYHHEECPGELFDRVFFEGLL